MNQANYEWLLSLSGILHIIVQVLCFSVMWHVFCSGKHVSDIVLTGILAIVNVLAGLWPGVPAWVRYTLSAVLVLAFAFARYQRRLEKPVFVLLLFYQFHGLSFLISNSIYQYGSEKVFAALDSAAPDYLSLVYRNTALGQIVLVFVYGLVLFAMIGILGKTVRKSWDMKWQDVIFLSVLNIAGVMLARIVLELSMIKMEQGMFFLFEERKDMLWKVPVIALLLWAGEVSAICIFQRYEHLQQERQKHFVEEQQMKLLKQRLEEAERFYGSLRKVRHEMRNHMTSIRGLAAGGNYQAAEQYMDKLEDTMGTLDYRFATGNPVTDVVINDKYRKAAALGIDFQVNFYYRPEDTIPVFDLGILLNNLLDNALEACERLTDEQQRRICLSLKRKQQFLLLEVENTFDGAVKWEEGSELPATGKRSESSGQTEHGIGLKNVKEIAERCLGSMDIRISENTFKVMVMLQQETETEV